MNRLLKHIALLLLLLLPIHDVIATNLVNVKSGTNIYIDNSVSKWNYSHYYVVIGKDQQNAALLPLSIISNTQLLYIKPNQDYNTKDYICLFAANDSWGDSTTTEYSYLQAHGKNITLSEINWNYNSNEYYLIKPKSPSSLSNPDSINSFYIGKDNSYISYFNKSITIKAYISSDGGTSYREADTWPATISTNFYKFNTSPNSVESANSSNSAKFNISAAYTSIVSLDTTNVNANYTFAGWFTTNGDTLSKESPYNYEVTDETTICAYFHEKPKISLNIVGKGTTSFNPSSRITVSPIITGVPQKQPHFVCYSFIKKPTGATTNIILKDQNDAIVTGNTIGEYVIQANLIEGTDCNSGTILASTKDTFNIEQYVTLSVSGDKVVNGNIRLSTNHSIDGTFSFTVIDPDGGTPQTIPSSNNDYCNYTLTKQGEYTFSVTLTATIDEKNITASDQLSWIAANTLYIKYPFPKSNDPSDGREWKAVSLSYDDATGNYYYYQANYQASPTIRYRSSYESGEGYGGSTCANILTDPSFASDICKEIKTNGLSSSYDAVVFMYDPRGDTIYLQAPSTKYRLKSICGNKTYYSNAFISFPDSISFYATFDGTLIWQESQDNGLTWSSTTGDTLSVSIPHDGVFMAKASARNQNGLIYIIPYSGIYRVFGAATYPKDTMEQFENISTNEFYNHYWVKWIKKGTNTYATVGNNINNCLADRKVDYEVPDSTNVRYAYNPSTNYFSRTFLAGSKGTTANTFLRVYGDNICKQEGENITQIDDLEKAKPFTDGSNWIYPCEVVINSAPAQISIYSTFDNKNTFLLSKNGLETDRLVILGENTHISPGMNLHFRIIYDFKTNRVIAAWAPTNKDTIKTAIDIDADMLIMRDSYNDSLPSVVQFAEDGKAKILHRIILGVDINRNTLFDRTTHERLHNDASHLFQVTLPYETDLTSIFGLPNYGTEWVIQDYKGEIRAKVGWTAYQENDFWATLLWNNGTKLRKGRGYVIATHYAYNDFATIGEDENQIAKKTLYFPSPYNADGYVLDGKLPDAMMFSELKCTKKGREPYDSNWRCVGPPSFYPVYASADKLEHFYSWDGTHDCYTLQHIKDTVMHPTHNYIIQYSGLVSWLQEQPSSSPLRRDVTAQTADAHYRLDIRSAISKPDYTYIRLSASGSDDYVIGSDVLKMFASTKAQLYTVTRDNELAANHLCDTTTQVILGTNLPSSDSVTISLGRMTPGALSPILYDAQEHIYTNLAETDYTFSGTIGHDDTRFTLFFGQTPQQGTDLSAAQPTNTLHACLADGQIVLSSAQPINGCIRLFDAAGRLLSSFTNTNAIPAPAQSGIYLIWTGNQTTRIIIP